MSTTPTLRELTERLTEKPAPAPGLPPGSNPAAAPAPVRVKQRLSDKNFGVAAYKFNRWSVTLEEHQTLRDALDPAFWLPQLDKIRGHDKNLGRGDIIELRKLDTGFYAELLVAEIGPDLMRVEIVRRHEPKTIEIPDDVPFTTRWNTGTRVHEVIRKADKAVMAGNFQTRSSAARWIADYMKIHYSRDIATEARQGRTDGARPG